MTIREARAKTAASLSPLGSGQLDADVLLKWILGVDQTRLLFYADTQLTARQEAQLSDAVVSRSAGLELCYITGHKEFYALDFALSRAVLPPKPDTELLVDNTIDLVQKRITSLPQGEQVVLCDMCCGTGCVGLSVLHTLCQRMGCVPPVELVLVDVMDEAIAVARDNTRRLLDSAMLRRVTFIQSDLFESLPQAMRFDVIAANPPYIPFDEAKSLLADGRGEPLVALCGDDRRGAKVTPGDGLDITRRLVRSSVVRLKSGGALVLETGEDQVTEVQKMMVKAGFAGVEVTRDLASKPRNVKGWLWKKEMK